MSKTFAVIEDDKVTNTIVAETIEIATEVSGRTCIEIPEGILISVGFTYNGEVFLPEGATPEDLVEVPTE